MIRATAKRMIPFHIVSILLGLLSSIVIASGTYSPEVSDFLKELELNEKSLGYRGYWFTNIVRIEKELSIDKQLTITALPMFAKKALNYPKITKMICIKTLIEQHYKALITDKKYHYQVIRALDKYINDETAAYMILKNWLKKNGTSIKKALESLKSACGVSVHGKTAASAKKALEKCIYTMPDKDPHENIWFYLTYKAIVKSFKLPREKNLVLLSMPPVLSHRTSIKKIIKFENTYPDEWLLYQIKRGIVDSDDVDEIVKNNGKQKECTRKDLWTRTSLEILKEEDPKQVLSKLPLKLMFVTGTVPKFRLLELKDAKEIIRSNSIEGLAHMCFVFVFGINIGSFGLEGLAMKAAHYDMDKLAKLAGWIEEIYKDNDSADSKDKSVWIDSQIHTPYLNIKSIFKKGQLNEEYAKEIAKDDLVTLKMIKLAIDQQDELIYNNQPILFDSQSISRGLFGIPEFCYEKGLCDWNCAVSKHFRHLISNFIIFAARKSGNYERLHNYLGYEYDENTRPPFYELSIDVLKSQYKLYLAAYEKIIKALSKELSTFTKEANRIDLFKYDPVFKLGALKGELKNLLKIRLEDVKKELKQVLRERLENLGRTSICKEASFISHPELTLKYCIADLQSILSLKLDFDVKHFSRPSYTLSRFYNDFIVETNPIRGLLRNSGELRAPEMTLEVADLKKRFPNVKEIGVIVNYVQFIFKVDYRPPSPISLFNPREITPKLGLAKFERLANCKTDLLWEQITQNYMYLLTLTKPLTLYKVNDLRRGLINRTYALVKESRLPSIAYAIACSLNLVRLTKKQLQNIMRDALLDTLAFPVAFFWHLLKAHFKKKIFEWETLYSEMGLTKELSLSIDGIKILEEIKRINLEKNTYYHLKHLNRYRQEYDNHLKYREIYNKKYENGRQENLLNLEKYADLLKEFDKNLKYSEIYNKKYEKRQETFLNFKIHADLLKEFDENPKYSKIYNKKYEKRRGEALLNFFKCDDLLEEFDKNLKYSEIYNKKYENRRQETLLNFFKYDDLLKEFDKNLTVYDKHVRKLANYNLETSNDFFEIFSHLLNKQSFHSMQYSMEPLIKLFDDLDIKKPNNNHFDESFQESFSSSLNILESLAKQFDLLTIQIKDISNKLN